MLNAPPITDTTALRAITERATQGEWMVQDGCSWRRIGTRENDGDVICPTKHHRDGHPDLTATQGNAQANLTYIATFDPPTILALLDHIDAQARTLEERAWRPIEAAPGDGSDILLIDIDRPHVPPMVAGWSQGAETWMDYDGHEIRFDPTHWQPLPEPPASQSLARQEGVEG